MTNTDHKKSPGSGAIVNYITSVASEESRCNHFLTPIKAIRAYCLDCCCGSKNEVRLCPSEKCTLHPYRLGKRPKKSCKEPVVSSDSKQNRC